MKVVRKRNEVEVVKETEVVEGNEGMAGSEGTEGLRKVRERRGNGR